MRVLALFQEIAPSGGTIGIVAAATFLLVLLGVSFIAFKALKKTVKMAFRMAIVGVILLIGLAGSLALWYFGSGSQKAKPPVEKKRAMIQASPVHNHILRGITT